MNILPSGLSMLPFQPLQNLPNMTNMAINYQNLLSLAANLQATIIKQQAVIENLVNRVNNCPHPSKDYLRENAPVQVKYEEGALISPISKEKVMSQATNDSSEERSESEEERSPKIVRRYGFKGVKKTKSSCPSQTEGGKAKNNSSNAKHLWVNYGRRIIEYAISQTNGSMQMRVKQLGGKLNSKKDFETAFQVGKDDSSEDRMFKTLLGRLAIDFVKYKASPTFESSKYKEQMISQRHVVAAWIERLISE